ncbi:hypothetical protein D3C81_1754040 [compost metagenome]
MVTYQRALSGLGFSKRQMQRLDKRTKRLMCAGVTHATTAHHQRALFTRNQRPGPLQTLRVRRSAFNVVNTAREEAKRILPDLTLHILRQANRHCASICGVSKCSHRT